VAGSGPLIAHPTRASSARPSRVTTAKGAPGRYAMRNFEASNRHIRVDISYYSPVPPIARSFIVSSERSRRRNASMNSPQAISHRRPTLYLSILGLVLSLSTIGCGGIRAALPMKSMIPAADPLPIDGIYTLEENGKKYRVEAGRAWILEQLFIRPIRYDPGQVTGKDLFQTAPNEYRGQNLATIGPVTITAKEDRLELLVVSPVGQVQYTMHVVEIDDPAWYAAQLASDIILSRSAPSLTSQGTSLAPNNPGSITSLDEATRPLSASQRSAFGSYHALVIGNDGYRELPTLATAINDAKAIAALLRDRYGFDVTLLQDATRSQTLKSLRSLRESLSASDNLLIYYAGHGWLDQDADEGYWLPVDAEEESDVHWISNATITSYLRSIQSKHIVIVADSCYSGTLTRGIKLEVKAPDYLNRLARQRARIALSSGGLEPVADSGGGGKHSAFARHFIDELKANQGVLDSTTLYSPIRRPVMLAADQAPELADIRKAGHQGGDFLFIRAGE
jgi:hypothetical protein